MGGTRSGAFGVIILDSTRQANIILLALCSWSQKKYFRSQISLSAFRFLFSEFSSSFPETTNQFKDHCILAFNGCHVVYATNAEIIEDYNVPRLVDYKGYNHLHLNGFVDVISQAFIDVMIQPGQHPDERATMRSMLEQFNPDTPDRYIITADRGYESYDLIFQCELKNLGYVFRVKAPSSGKCILTSYRDQLPDDQDEFEYESIQNHSAFSGTAEWTSSSLSPFSCS